MLNKYKNDSVAYIEEVFKIELLDYQKFLLKNMFEGKSVITSRLNGRDFIQGLYITYMKDMKMDFWLATPEGIKVYEKGKLVEIKKYKST